MPSLVFKQVDVFTAVPFKGNPVAVIFDTTGQLDDGKMQQIAKWTNLSETTFVRPKTADEANYLVRIFTPRAELPFAGHPTIGTAHALLEAGLIKPSPGGILKQQCAAGIIKLEVSMYKGCRCIYLEMPQPKVDILSLGHLDQFNELLGPDVKVLNGQFMPRFIDVGPRWLVAQLKSANAVLDVRPNYGKIAEFSEQTNSIGIVIFGEYAEKGQGKPAIEVRAFAPLDGINEDPVCGSGNGCVGVFIRDSGQLGHFGHSFLSTQGAIVGRAGQIRIEVDEKNVKIAGMAVTVIDGHISI